MKEGSTKDAETGSQVKGSNFPYVTGFWSMGLSRPQCRLSGPTHGSGLNKGRACRILEQPDQSDPSLQWHFGFLFDMIMEQMPHASSTTPSMMKR